MKEIKLYISDIELFKEKCKDFIVLELKTNYNELLIKIDNNKKDTILNFYYNLGIYLVCIYTKNEIKKYPKQFQEEIRKNIYDTNYFYELMFKELIKFFKKNNVFKEHIFLKFNLKSFNEEIESIFKELKHKEDEDNYIKSFYRNLIKEGFPVTDYEILKVDYDIDMIKLVNKKGDYITNKNLFKKLNISLEFELLDKWLFNLVFCSTLCSLLKVKELIIPIEYKELYEDLMDCEDFNHEETKIKIEENIL